MICCKIEGCNKTAWARGLCSAHLRMARLGAPGIVADPPKRRTRYSGELCNVDECSKPAVDLGMCGAHAQRVRRYGDAHYLTSEIDRRTNNRAAQLARFEVIKETTYRKRMGRHEHRVVAEEMIGRPLKSHEIVHHKDGNKHNNRPDNLEVMTQSEHIALHRDEINAGRRK